MKFKVRAGSPSQFVITPEELKVIQAGQDAVRLKAEAERKAELELAAKREVEDR